MNEKSHVSLSVKQIGALAHVDEKEERNKCGHTEVVAGNMTSPSLRKTWASCK